MSTVGQSTMSRTQVKFWYKRSKEGREDNNDDTRPGRTSMSITDEYIEALKEMTLILPVILCGAEAWTLLSTDAAALRVFERKVLHKIFGPVRVGNDFRNRFNSELYELLNDIDVVQRINIQRLRWLVHVV